MKIVTMLTRPFLLLVLVNAALATPVPNNEASDVGTQNGKSICLTPACIHAASSVLKLMDRSVNPCDDFYNFACGGFTKRTSMPDNEPIYMYFNVLENRVDDKLRHALETEHAEDEARPIAMAKRYYQLCMDTQTIESNELHMANSMVSSIGGWPVLEGSAWKEVDFDWKALTVKMVQLGHTSTDILKISVEQDMRNSSRMIISVDQPVMKLERSVLLNGLADETVAALYEYIVGVVVAFGAEKETAVREVTEVVEFMTEMAKITVPSEQQRDIASVVQYMTIAQLQTKFPQMQWLEFINNILAVGNVSVTSEEKIQISSMSYIEEMFKLLENTPKRVQCNYMLTQFVNDMVPYLNKRVRIHEFRYNNAIYGTTSFDPRWKQCVQKVIKVFEIPMSALYVRTYFYEEAKTNAANLLEYFRKSFRSILTDTNWMDAETKKNALDKIDAMSMYVAYPVELLEDKPMEELYEDLTLHETFLGSMIKIQKYTTSRNLKMLHNLTLVPEWSKNADAISINAFYSPQNNAVSLPAGILQGAVFNHKRPNYMNFGSLGAVIGHEITHGFDDSGKQYNKKGDIEDWWGADTKEKYLEKAQCIIDQYSNYTMPEVNLQLNGIKTLNENIADNGGVKAAYMAYNAWVEKNGKELRLPGLDYTPNQMYWIASANLGCTVARKEYLKQLIIDDVHSPSYYRVIGSFSNSEHFAQDFNCPVGSRMNPEHKCHVW